MATLTTQQLKQALDLSKQIETLNKKKSDLQVKLERMLAEGSAKQKPGRPKKKATRKPAAKNKAKAKPAKKRAKGSHTSKQSVIDVLKVADKPLGVSEVLEALTAKGQKSASKNPKNALGVMLYGDKETFKRAGRGKFSLK